MEIGVISVRYARALLKSATEQRIEERVYREMQALVQSYLKVPQLRFTIDNPMLAKEQKKKLLATACGSEIAPLTRRFIDLVVDKGRESTMQFMAASYITLYRKQKQMVPWSFRRRPTPRSSEGIFSNMIPTDWMQASKTNSATFSHS